MPKIRKSPKELEKIESTINSLYANVTYVDQRKSKETDLKDNIATRERSYSGSSTRKRYRGELYGNEQEEMPKICTDETFVQVNHGVGQLSRRFYRQTSLGKFVPFPNAVNKERAKNFAEYAGNLVHYVLRSSKTLGKELIKWFKSAFFDGLGILKVYWKEETTWTVETYDNLDIVSALDEYQKAKDLKDVEDLKLYRYDENDEEKEISPPSAVDPTDQRQYAVYFRRKITNAEPMIEHVPGYCFFFSKGTTDWDSCECMGDEKEMTESQIMKFHPDLEKSVYDKIPWIDQPGDNATRRVVVSNVYAVLMYRGKPTLMHVVRAGNDKFGKALDYEPVDVRPFIPLDLEPDDENFIGVPLADKVEPWQNASTGILRAILANTSKALAYQRLYKADGYTRGASPFANSAYIGVSVKDPANTENWSAPPLVSPEVLPILQEIQKRSQAPMGLNTNVDIPNHQETVISSSMREEQSSNLIDSRTLLLFNCGVANIFESMLSLYINHYKGALTIVVDDEFIEYTPSTWPMMKFQPSIGLGRMNRNSDGIAATNVVNRLMSLGQMQILEKVSNIEGIRKALIEEAKKMGIIDPETYYNVEPEEVMNQPEEPDPNARLADSSANLMDQQAESKARETEIKERAQDLKEAEFADKVGKEEE